MNSYSTKEELRRCFREPIPEIMEASELLNKAVDAHLSGNRILAAAFIAQSNIPAIREWTESIWGKDSPYVVVDKSSEIQNVISIQDRVVARMPNTDEKRKLHERDGYNCRFCGIPVIRKEVRVKISQVYPIWGRKNHEQHAAFQAMWAQYDHILPHAKGGTNDLENLVVACAPCNFGRMDFTLEQVRLADPRNFAPRVSEWDGLERFK